MANTRQQELQGSKQTSDSLAAFEPPKRGPGRPKKTQHRAGPGRPPRSAPHAKVHQTSPTEHGRRKSLALMGAMMLIIGLLFTSRRLDSHRVPSDKPVRQSALQSARLLRISGQIEARHKELRVNGSQITNQLVRPLHKAVNDIVESGRQVENYSTDLYRITAPSIKRAGTLMRMTDVQGVHAALLKRRTDEVFRSLTQASSTVSTAMLITKSRQGQLAQALTDCWTALSPDMLDWLFPWVKPLLGRNTRKPYELYERCAQTESDWRMVVNTYRVLSNAQDQVTVEHERLRSLELDMNAVTNKVAALLGLGEVPVTDAAAFARDFVSAVERATESDVDKRAFITYYGFLH